MKKIIWLIVLMIGLGGMALAAYPAKTYTFVDRTVAEAAEVNSNFDALYNGLSTGLNDINVYTLKIGGTTAIDNNRDGAFREVTLSSWLNMGDNDITNVGALTLDSLTADGSSIEVKSQTTFEAHAIFGSTVSFESTTVFNDTITAVALTVTTIEVTSIEATGGVITGIDKISTTTLEATGGVIVDFYATDISVSDDISCDELSANTVDTTSLEVDGAYITDLTVSIITAEVLVDTLSLEADGGVIVDFYATDISVSDDISCDELSATKISAPNINSTELSTNTIGTKQQTALKGLSVDAANPDVLSSELLSGDWNNHPTTSPYDTFTVSTNDITSAIWDGDGTNAYGCDRTFGDGITEFTVGALFLVEGTLTLNSGQAPSITCSDSPGNSPFYIRNDGYQIPEGAFSFTVKGLVENTLGQWCVKNTAACNWSIAGFTVKRVDGGNVIARGKFTGGGSDGIKVDQDGSVTVSESVTVTGIIDASAVSTGNESMKWDIVFFNLDGTSHDTVSYSIATSEIRALTSGANEIWSSGGTFYSYGVGNASIGTSAYYNGALDFGYGSFYHANDDGYIIVFYI